MPSLPCNARCLEILERSQAFSYAYISSEKGEEIVSVFEHEIGNGDGQCTIIPIVQQQRGGRKEKTCSKKQERKGCRTRNRRYK